MKYPSNEFNQDEKHTNNRRSVEHISYKEKVEGEIESISTRWQLIDSQFSYDGPLGAQLNEEGTQANVTVWSPSADQVNVIIFDRDNQERVIGKFVLDKGEKGEWYGQVDIGMELTNYLYQYEIIREGKKYWVLDPYAKSMGVWNIDAQHHLPSDVISKPVGKAAFVKPEALGPQNLDFAQIKGFDKREDAIIYEVHVRDFTSDQSIRSDLKAQFGTFAAFVEKLDYIQDLGVTHIQLLPVLNYYKVNESDNQKDLLEYVSSNCNYNWGYDPHHYFALSGMYSENPADPSLRIVEFKNLVQEIHNRGMGVILDVVYNHTASLHILEDLEPNYYHFMDLEGRAKESFGGGRLGTTHYMSRRLLLDSIAYLVDEFKVDGFRFDMMGDHDATTIQKAFDVAVALNPKMLMLGEGWVTYVGDDQMPEQPADQSWMQYTHSVGSFSDEIRNELKSGFECEGLPRFLTGGAREVNVIYQNIIANPGNFLADDPGDVIQYIAAHDNLTLHDVIAQSIKKDPKRFEAEILKRIRLGNTIVLTSQGTPFIHAGQEFGRTKQFRDPAYIGIVEESLVPHKATYMMDDKGQPFEYPYFIHDSYNSSDVINRIDWQKATEERLYPENVKTQKYTKGLIKIRRSTDAFSRGTRTEIDENVSLITDPSCKGYTSVKQEDLVIGYQAIASNGDIYAVFVNADMNQRIIEIPDAYVHLLDAVVIADGQEAGLTSITEPKGVRMEGNTICLEGLTSAILLVKNTH